MLHTLDLHSIHVFVFFSVPLQTADVAVDGQLGVEWAVVADYTLVVGIVLVDQAEQLDHLDRLVVLPAVALQKNSE